MKKAASIDEYLADFPKNVQEIIQKMRAVIHAAAPDAAEDISYGMPAFRQNGVVVYFGAFKEHIGFFPTGAGENLKKK